MKQLLCEMCGSNDLIKQDGVFVCQSCGCKYSVEEARKLMVEGTVDVSGSTVILDNSQQIENDLKRAKQFEEQGNYSLAKEYYDKVLDAEADNVEAKEGYERIVSKSKYIDCYVMQPNVSPEESLKKFFIGLSKRKNIACDIYGEIKIKSVKEKYFDFSFIKASGKVNWTAIRCDEYKENQTVYKDKWNSNTNKYDKVPTTEQVTRVNRTPVSGSNFWDCQELFLASDAVSSLSAKPFGEKLDDSFVTIQSRNFENYKPVELDAAKLIEENGQALYDGIEIELSTDVGREEEQAHKLMEKAMIASIEGEWNAGIHTYYENINTKVHISSQRTSKILIPVQIIIYEYKGKGYVAIADLLSDGPFVQTIPTDTKLDDSTKEIDSTKEQLSNNKRKNNGIIFIVLGIIGVPIIGAIVCSIKDGFDAYPYVVVPMMIICCLIGVCCLIAHYVRQNDIKNEIKNKTSEYENLLKPRNELLQKTQTLFFAKYSGKDSIEVASASAKVTDESIKDIHILTTVSDSYVDYNNDGLSSISKKDERIGEIQELAKEDKLQAIKKYMEIYNVGLAEAKEAVDKLIEE